MYSVSVKGKVIHCPICALVTLEIIFAPLKFKIFYEGVCGSTVAASSSSLCLSENVVVHYCCQAMCVLYEIVQRPHT